MSKYIDISEIPGWHVKWPCDEWARDIPEGKALEVTGMLDGQKAVTARAAIVYHIRSRKLPLIVISRGDRLFVARNEAP